MYILKQSSCSASSFPLTVQLWEHSIPIAIFPHFSFQYHLDLQSCLLRVGFLLFISFSSADSLLQNRQEGQLPPFSMMRAGTWWTWKASCSSPKHNHVVNVFQTSRRQADPTWRASETSQHISMLLLAGVRWILLAWALSCDHVQLPVVKAAGTIPVMGSTGQVSTESFVPPCGTQMPFIPPESHFGKK